MSMALAIKGFFFDRWTKIRGPNSSKLKVES